MSVTSPTRVGLDAEDFRRLGVRPQECRLAVIRSAAARSARALAEQQLTAPSDQAGLQLSRVATSAYRLLDPRQRSDVHQRTHVGRILPNALSSASETSFHSSLEAAVPETLFGVDSRASQASSAETELVEMTELDLNWTPRQLQDHQRVRSLRTTPSRRDRWRDRYPWIGLVLAGLAIGTLLGLVTLRVRYEQAEVATAPPQPPLSATTIPDPVPPGLESSVRVDPRSRSASAPAMSDRTTSVQRELEFDSPDAGTLDGMRASSVHASSVRASRVEVERPDLALESWFTESDPVSEQPLDESSATLDSFLSDPFLDWGSDDAPPSRQEIQIPSMEPPQIDPPKSSSTRSEMGQFGEILLEPGVPRVAVPEPGMVREARSHLVLLVPELAESVVVQSVEGRIAKLEALEHEQTMGTAQDWAARIWIGELAWLVEDVPQVSQRLEPLTHSYQVQLNQLLADTFVAACELASLPDTRRHLMSSGLALADQLLLAESFQECQRIVDALRESAEILESESGLTHLKQLSQAAEQMSRSSQAFERMIGDVSNSKSNAGDVGIAGRFYCLMLRRWDTGLEWLVKTSDSRIARVARQELELGKDAPVDDLITVSERWLKLAARSSGRASDSMRLHAIELMRKAQDDTSGLRRLEIERTIDTALEELPPYLRGTNSQARTESVPPENVKPVALKPKNGLSGRIEIGGQDIGVQLDYEIGVAFTQSVLDTIAARINLELSKMSIQFLGEFELDEPQSIAVAIAPVQQGVVQQVRIDGKPIDLDALDTTAELELTAGTHRLAWVIEADRFSRVFLSIRDAGTGRRLAVLQPAVTAEQPPTKLTVALVRGET